MSDPRTILVVEDSDEDFGAMMWAWEKAGILTPVIRSKDGEDALDRLFRRGEYAALKHDELPALVVLDLNLPRTDGRAVLAAIKKDEFLQLTPVVVLTTSANPKDIEACYRVGANSYIMKPIRLAHLCKILQEIVSYWMDVVYLPRPGLIHGE
jgi:CheY-like chemotaxis protein